MGLLNDNYCAHNAIVISEDISLNQDMFMILMSERGYLEYVPAEMAQSEDLLYYSIFRDSWLYKLRILED